MTFNSLYDKIFMAGKKTNQQFAKEHFNGSYSVNQREEDYGSIYYYDHKFKYGENPEEYVTYLAEEITIFINSLVEEENYEDSEA